jgi:hypothetical protein
MKLVKRENDYCLYNESEETIAASWANVTGKKLSKQNCDEIFGVVDVEELTEEECLDETYWVKRFYKKGFNKAMELYQPTEIDVEIEMENKEYILNQNGEGFEDQSYRTWEKVPKLDSNGNLILRKL